MRWKALCALFLILGSAMLGGCSVTHSVSTPAVKELRQDLRQLSPSVQRVHVAFTRPNLTIRADTAGLPDPAVLEAMLERVKAFATVEHVNEAARSVKWRLPVSHVHFTVNSDGNAETAEAAYFARYFRTSDASDDSPDNIEAYRTWYEMKKP